MFEIFFLGTSASAPSARRGLSSLLVKHNEHRFLIDCGEGTQRQILQSGIGFKSLNRILLTHGHLDHILGLGGLMSTFIRWESIEHLEICAGRSVLERVKVLVNDVVLRGTTPPMMLSYREITPGLVYDEDDFTVTAVPVTHRGPDCLGYIFEEKSRRPFLADKADTLGIPFGRERSLLVNGQSITLTNGSTIHPQDVLGEELPGTKLAVIGDTGRAEELLPYVAGAHGLVIESTYLDVDVDMARQFSHLTARDAAELAGKASVGLLMLNHISRRYREKEVLAEAQSIFPNTIVARDFDYYSVKKPEP